MRRSRDTLFFCRAERVRRALWVSCLCWLTACGGERAALLRGQTYYEDNQYERALSIWRELERQEASFPPVEFARYAYLRGMTDYRLGFHPDARHWLGLAKVSEQEHPGGLDGAWLPRLDAALADLDRRTFAVPATNSDAVQSIEAPGLGLPAIPSPPSPLAPADPGHSGPAAPNP